MVLEWQREKRTYVDSEKKSASKNVNHLLQRTHCLGFSDRKKGLPVISLYCESGHEPFQIIYPDDDVDVPPVETNVVHLDDESHKANEGNDEEVDDILVDKGVGEDEDEEDDPDYEVDEDEDEDEENEDDEDGSDVSFAPSWMFENLEGPSDDDIFASKQQPNQAKGDKEQPQAKDWYSDGGDSNEFLNNYLDKLRDDPWMKVDAFQKQIRRELTVDVSKSQLYRAKNKAKEMIEGDHSVQYAEQWCRSHFSPRSKCDYLVNNLNGSFNNYILEARDKPIISMLEWIRRKVMNRFQIKRMGMEKYNQAICLRIKAKLDVIKKDSKDSFAHFCGEYKFEVDCHDTTYTVDLKEKTCGCRQWDLTGIPCKHACAAIGLNKQKSNNEEVLPPFMRRPSGRPKKARRKAAEEAEDAGAGLSRAGSVGVANRGGEVGGAQRGGGKAGAPRGGQVGGAQRGGGRGGALRGGQAGGAQRGGGRGGAPRGGGRTGASRGGGRSGVTRADGRACVTRGGGRASATRGGGRQSASRGDTQSGKGEAGGREGDRTDGSMLIVDRTDRSTLIEDRTDRSSLIEDRMDGSLLIKNQTDGSSLIEDRKDGSSLIEDRTDGSSLIVDWTDGSSLLKIEQMDRR
ncbi:hypothetical protein RHMOL_Rhmol02G0179700 [Rhododendron molle]|uniref:Uncharacterized protein n=1 Tax=Rhododendron molle TaxID=49168 RepID=A0ACC0PR86_RHOML|nr:hypothetical protein RHMOL_Rhmol02G0179700 [Rhododendron molle]